MTGKLRYEYRKEVIALSSDKERHRLLHKYKQVHWHMENGKRVLQNWDREGKKI